MIQEVAKQLLTTMYVNRKRYDNCWDKVRQDRIEKIVPVGTDVEKLVNYLVENEYIKKVHKQCDKELIPAIQLRYNIHPITGEPRSCSGV